MAQQLSRDIAAQGFTNRVQLDQTSAAFKLYGGYRLHRHFGLEAGYVNFGKYDLSVDIQSPVSGRGTGDIKAHGFDFAAVGFLPATDTITLFGKIGAHRWNTKLRFGGPGGSFEESASGWTPVVGAGAIANLTRSLGLRFDVDYYNEIGDKDKTGESEVAMLTVNLLYRF